MNARKILFVVVVLGVLIFAGLLTGSLVKNELGYKDESVFGQYLSDETSETAIGKGTITFKKTK